MSEVEDEQFRKLRADLLINALVEIDPMIQVAVERAVTADVAASEALLFLRQVGNRIDGLKIAASFETDDPEEFLRETLFVDQYIKQLEYETFIYFVEAGNYIKIGYSRDPIRRLSQIQGGKNVKAPAGLDTSRARILAVEQGSQGEESLLHKRFAEYRVDGEWFAKNERLTHYIKSITTPA